MNHEDESEAAEVLYHIYSYDVWQSTGETFGTSPEFSDSSFFVCIASVFRWPYGLYGVGGCAGTLSASLKTPDRWAVWGTSPVNGFWYSCKSPSVQISAD